MNVITLIRKHKTTAVSDMLSILQNYDKKIISKSIHLALVAFFTNHFQTLNKKRLYELMRWVNKKFSELPSTSNVEGNLSKIRQVVKFTYGENSEEYKKSQLHLVFDPEQKQKNICLLIQPTLCAYKINYRKKAIYSTLYGNSKNTICD